MATVRCPVRSLLEVHLISEPGPNFIHRYASFKHYGDSLSLILFMVRIGQWRFLGATAEKTCCDLLQHCRNIF